MTNINFNLFIVKYLFIPSLFCCSSFYCNAGLTIIEKTETTHNLNNNQITEYHSSPTLMKPLPIAEQIVEASQSQKSVSNTIHQNELFNNRKNTTTADNNFYNSNNFSKYNVKSSLPHNGYYLASVLTPEELSKRALVANKVLISVYTDNDGDNLNVQAMARNQAENLKALLIQYGIPKEKIETRLITNDFIANNENSRNKAINRRLTVNFQ